MDITRPTTRDVLYTAGPIRGNGGNVQLNIEIARRLSKALWLAGWTVFCPHTNNSEIEGWGLAEYLAGDFEIISRCDAVVLLPGWEFSEGTRAEINFAGERNIPVLSICALLPREFVDAVVAEVQKEFGAAA